MKLRPCWCHRVHSSTRRWRWRQQQQLSVCSGRSASHLPTNSLCSALYVSWQSDAACICCREPGRAAIDWYLLSTGPTAANHWRGVQRPNNGTDRRTDARQFHRPCCAYYAISVKKSNKKFISSKAFPQNSFLVYVHTHTRLTALFPGLPR